MLAVEVLTVSLSFDALPQATLNTADSWLRFLGYAGPAGRFFSVAVVALLLLTAPRLPDYARRLSDQARSRAGFLTLLGIHLLVYAGFLGVTAALFSVPPVLAESQRGPASLLWLAGIAALLGSWALALAPARFWLDFLNRERFSLLLTAAAALVATLVAYQAQHLWQGLAYAALHLSHAALSLGYDDVIMDESLLLLGVRDFVVAIGYPCSGYEGMGLISVFTGLYLYLFRQDFRFPRALWLFPIGIFTIWIFNILRIVALIVIGAEISPTLALEGFHSQAGWISFLAVSSVILYGAHRSGFARHTARATGAPLRDNPAAATLLPLIAVLAVGLLTSAVAGPLDWLYPLRVLAGFAVLAYCWRALDLPPLRLRLLPLLVGLAVAGLWVLVATPQPDRDAAMAQAWQAQHGALAWAWLGVRAVGGLLLIPVVEELVFRGYLLARLSRQPLRLGAAVEPSWLALVVSAVLFGVLHDAWIAGTIAGLGYAWLRRYGDIWHAIQSHAVTNTALAVYVLTSGNWSIW